MKNLVSIIVPTKNSATTLGKCLKSLVEQTYHPIEIVVVDNFSTDKTLEIARRYTDKVFQRGPERSAQRNFGVDRARGDFIAIIDSDMELEPAVLRQCVDQLQLTQVAVGVVIPEQSFGKGFWSQCKRLERNFYLGVPYMEAGRFFRKELFVKAGGYDEQMVSGEDWDLSQRIEKFGPLERSEAGINHNEGHISLLKTIRKKYYYAQKFAHYTRKNTGTDATHAQTSIIGRYGLFLSQPKRLLNRPLLGFGMLFMKTCEFGFGGLGFIMAKIKYAGKRATGAR